MTTRKSRDSRRFKAFGRNICVNLNRATQDPQLTTRIPIDTFARSYSVHNSMRSASFTAPQRPLGKGYTCGSCKRQSCRFCHHRPAKLRSHSIGQSTCRRTGWSGSPLQTPRQPLEPQNGAVYLRQEKSNPHHRCTGNRARSVACQEVPFPSGRSR